MSWLFDYYRDQLHMDFFQRMSPEFSNESVNMSKFPAFINGFPYRAWQNGVRYSLKMPQNSSTGNERFIKVAFVNSDREIDFPLH
jgi:hypothetical protein